MISSKKEYEKRISLCLNEMNLNNDTVYNYLNEEQVKIIRKFYELYTTWSFVKITKNLLLTVDESKLSKLKELKGDGEWEFNGMVDVLKRGGDTCELGHPLRYVYSAKNKQNGNILKFGVRCASDFFNLNDKEVKALIKIKDDMMSDIKELVVIKEYNLLDSQIKYDWGLLGGIYILRGLQGIEEIKGKSPFFAVARDFIIAGLPLPKSLLSMLESENNSLEELFLDKRYLGIDERVDKLKKSKISCISKMFTYSEFNIIDKAKMGEIPKNSTGFFNFSNINDLEIGASIWTSRENRLLNASEYFEKMGVLKEWDRIYKYMIEHCYKREEPELYYCVEIMMLFSTDIDVREEDKCREDGIPLSYSYKNYKMNKKSYDNFDKLVDLLASRSFITSVKEVSDLILEEDRKKEEERLANEKMMSYLKENLEKDKYSGVYGITGVQNIVIDKGLSFDGMSENQKRYVKSIYENMLKVDNPAKRENQVEEINEEINKRYKLVEKPDILAKIQRLQTEVNGELPQFLRSVMTTIMKYKYVTEKQIKYINDGYSKYILNEEPVKKVDKKAGTNSVGVRKWTLVERADIQDKIMELKRYREYSNLPSAIKSIMENILTYNTVSEKQAETIENTYRRYFG